MLTKLVMLVDDNETDNYVNRAILERCSFSKDIVIKNNCESALQYLHDNQDDINKIPDLLFLDINMPRMNGFEFLSAFGSYPNPVKDKCHIIVLSSSDNKNDIQKIIGNSNVNNYINKPLSREDLINLKGDKRHMPKTPGGWDI